MFLDLLRLVLLYVLRLRLRAGHRHIHPQQYNPKDQTQKTGNSEPFHRLLNSLCLPTRLPQQPLPWI